MQLHVLPNVVTRNPHITTLHFVKRWSAVFNYVKNGTRKPLVIV
jgi:hypothetical protein